mmetsp:Transcript_21268/g.34245  ORF Transcript_21268/g.34245 Transcript_21268/m.34245 type:complete len:84 (-) Transcript_21268:176-427(-)
MCYILGLLVDCWLFTTKDSNFANPFVTTAFMFALAFSLVKMPEKQKLSLIFSFYVMKTFNNCTGKRYFVYFHPRGTPHLQCVS